ncbi:MAG: hypothetical protein ACREAM_10430, partial [Blastocatellia bacterium]
DCATLARKIRAGGNMPESSATSHFGVQKLNVTGGVNSRLRRLPEPEFTPLHWKCKAEMMKGDRYAQTYRGF